MANHETAQVSSLPLPPAHYYNIYTDENVRLKRVPRPPPIPVHESYSMFGATFNADDAIIRPLETQGIRRLYPQHCDRRRELRKLNHSLLVNFLDLLDLLVMCPDSPRRAEKVDDLSLIFIHIHHLLNEFRPHQARETLRVMLELQRRQRIETTERFKKHLEKAKEMVNTAIQQMPDCADGDNKLLINTEMDEPPENNGQTEGEMDPAVELDRQMCAIIDNL